MKIISITLVILFYFSDSPTNHNVFQSFLNEGEIKKNFSELIENKNSLFVVDKTGSLKIGDTFNWDSKVMTVINDGRINKIYPGYWFKDSCNYFVLMNFEKSKRKTEVLLLQPCSGLYSQAIVIKKHSTIKVKKIVNSAS